MHSLKITKNDSNFQHFKKWGARMFHNFQNVDSHIYKNMFFPKALAKGSCSNLPGPVNTNSSGLRKRSVNEPCL